MNGNFFTKLQSPLNTIGQAATRRNASIGKLSSGIGLQSAKDDPAGFSIAINMDAELKSLQQASSNTSNALSMLRTAEGGMSNSADTIIRMKELAVQAANDSLAPEQRDMIQQEIDTLASSLDDVAQTTEFNGRQLLDGSEGTLTFQVGTGSGPENQVTYTPPDISAAALGLDGASVATQADAQALIDASDAALDTLNTQQAEVGATMNQLDRAYSNVQETIVNTSDALSRLRDTDFARESTELAGSLVMEKANIALLAQSNANTSHVLKLLG